MGALSTQYNDTPEKASRAYDKNRDGFVIAGGGGMVVVEELEHALARGAKIYAGSSRAGGVTGLPGATRAGVNPRRLGALHRHSHPFTADRSHPFLAIDQYRA